MLLMSPKWVMIKEKRRKKCIWYIIKAEWFNVIYITATRRTSCKRKFIYLTFFFLPLFFFFFLFVL
ncbi:hypothetical protein BDA99DRAFT_513696 [Phascolomyces articulosus]|uniref:Uncharacterized protein n=1 Tax=Phascolomyces articulosus TaxID=60185 RepID=A0AAD5K7J3_9FUNG|nr:hypothetical protein BDA99DRAFT_513696 [Phascolomyces articulosus]